MDYTTMGRMGDYVKNMRMEGRWMEKKKTKNYTAKETLAESRLSEYEKNRRAEIQSVQEQIDEMNKNKDSDLDRIMMKVNNGKELTQSEKEYLRKKSPQVYQEVVETEQAQKCYEDALKRCRTKEDVQRLKNMEMGQRLSAVKSVMNNPNIPEGEKLGLVLKEYKKMKAALEVERKFIESGAYEELPTDAEYSEAIQEEAEIKKEELQGTDESQKDEEAEDIDENETLDKGSESSNEDNFSKEPEAKNNIEGEQISNEYSDRAELEKEIQKAKNKFENVAKKRPEGYEFSVADMYKIETADDLMSFGARFDISFESGFEANA